MQLRTIAMTMLGLILLPWCAGRGYAEDVVVHVAEGGGSGVVVKLGDVGGAVVAPGTPWGGVYAGGGFGGGAAGFEQFMMTLTQLNMTPDLTLDKQEKQKLQEIHDQWSAAQSKFLADNQEEFQKIGRAQMEAFNSKEPEKVKAAMQKYQELYAKGPKAEEYIAKAKAALAPEQLEVVEAKLKKDEADRKAMMLKWQEHEKSENKEAPATR